MRNALFLVVDDSALTRKLVSSVIRTKLDSDRILTAANGHDALRLLENNEIDLIVSDWNMEGMGGDELLAAVRRHERYKNVPFVMVTTNNRREFIMTALKLGVSQYVIKPFTTAELEQKIRSSWTAANKRRSERHSGLPPHRIALRIGAEEREATAVNLSGNGILLRLKYDSGIALYGRYALSMRFAEKNSEKTWRLEAVEGRAVRIEGSDPEGGTCLLALAFDADRIPGRAGRELDSLIAHLGARNPEVIES